MITTDLIDYMKENTGKNIVSADIYFINSSDFSMNLPEEFNNGLSRDVIKKHIEYYRNDSEEKVYEVKGKWNEIVRFSTYVTRTANIYIHFFNITIIF